MSKPLPRLQSNKEEAQPDLNLMADIILDGVEPQDIPVDYIFHLAVCDPTGDLVILLGHDICDFRYRHPRFNGWREVSYAVNTPALLKATLEETTDLWNCVTDHLIDDDYNFDFDDE